MPIRYRSIPMPIGHMYHGPGSAESTAGLSKYHEGNSFRGIDYAATHGYQWIDLDHRYTSDGVDVGAHSDHTPQWEGFSARGVVLRVLSKLPWRLVAKLRRRDGYVIRRFADLLAYAAKKGVGVQVDLKQPMTRAQRDAFAAECNRSGAKVAVKCDGTKVALVTTLMALRAENGFWVRFNAPLDTSWRAPSPAPGTAAAPAPASVQYHVRFAPPSPPMIPARWKGGAQTPRTIVMHSTVTPTGAGWARKVAHMFATETKKTSAHYVVDAAEVIQCVGDHTVAFHCGHNQDSIGVEMCDEPDAKSSERWNDADHRAMFNRAASLVAQLCLAYDIPATYVDAAGLKAGKHGITTHAEETAAFHESAHWDPGAWPQLSFLAAVRAEIARLKKVTK